MIEYPGPGRAVFPWIFNVADVLLCTGVGMMIVYSLLQGGREPQNVGVPPVKPAPKPQMNSDANR